MTKSRTTLLGEIQEFLKRHGRSVGHGRPYGGWYVGTAAKPREKMFADHGFTNGDVGLFRETGSDDDAASLAAFLIKRGCTGDASAKPGAASIYLFKMTAATRPAAPA